MALEFKDYYRILGVDRKADEKAIKSAYRKLARKHHPDVAKGKENEEKFANRAEAYDVLSDPDKRRRYDSLGDWQRYATRGARPGLSGGSRKGESGDFSDFFQAIFAISERGPPARDAEAGAPMRILGEPRAGRGRGPGGCEASIAISLDAPTTGRARP
jgi:DnaJ-class molecular chaperone